MSSPIDNGRSATTSAGFVMEVLLRVVLLLAVLGQVLYLASRHRVRVDLTEEKAYSLTDSTQRVLSGLQDRLLVECYFTREDELPTALRQLRRELDNFLDEYVQISNGKVVVQKLDPLDDQIIREKAERLGIRPLPISESGDASLTYKEIWQGVRMMYGAEKQEVVEFLQFQPATAAYEAMLTPKIKALSVAVKPKIGLLAFGTEAGGGNPMMGGGGQSVGYNQLNELTKGRYDLQNVNLDQGQLVPDDITSMLLVRPKKLTDRQKYALDQFLMRGGKLVVFADTWEYEIGQMRSFRGRQVAYDAPDAKLKFLDQLACYGAKVESKLVGDALDAAQQKDPFQVPRFNPLFGTVLVPEPYPYWLRALKLDYASLADRFLLQHQAADGSGEELVERYRKTFQTGVNGDSELIGDVKWGPGMYWPCPVSLTDALPEGVSGQVLLRSSPLSWAEEPAPDLNPLGWDRRDARAQNAAIQLFRSKWQSKVMSEPRQQFGLMVALNGGFKSFFEGKEIPPKQKPEATPSLPGGPTAIDPLDEPIQEQPFAIPGTEPAAGEPKAETGEPKSETGEPKSETGEPKSETGEPKSETGEKKSETGEKKSGDGGDGGHGATPQDPPAGSAQEPAKGEGETGAASGEAGAEPAAEGEAPAQEPGAIGPPAPEAGGKPADQDPAPIFAAAPGAQLIVIGDADFIRDDLITGEHRNAGGPFSNDGSGVVFFGNLLDHLAEDRDLLALRNKTSPDRTIRLVEEDPMTDRETYDETVKTRGNFVRWANIVVPPLAILVIWLIAGLRRRARKQQFLASVRS